MNLVVLIAGLAAAGLAWFAFRRWVYATLLFWLLVVFFVPVWWSFTYLTDWRPYTVATLLILASYPGRLPRHFGLADLGLTVFFAAALLPVVVGGSSVGGVFGLLTNTMLGYLLGRAMLDAVGADRVYQAMAIIGGVAGGLGILEFLLDFHLWSLIGPKNALYQIWGSIQYRAGLPRSEGAFGHSIAFACTLALVIPMIFAARLSTWMRLALTAAVMGGIVFSFSRGGMLSAALCLVLVALFGGPSFAKQARNTALLGLTGATLLILPFITQVLALAGSEASDSAGYRGQLFDLVATMPMVGAAASSVTLDGQRYYAGFRSIDSQLILTGLTYGWLVMLIGAVLVFLAAVVVVRGQATPAMLSVVGQIPAILSVAAITQYSMAFWFTVGLAVAGQAVTRAAPLTSESALQPAVAGLSPD
jgi:hypothetical protein